MSGQSNHENEEKIKWEEKSFIEKLKDVVYILGALIATIGVITQGIIPFINSIKEPTIIINNYLALPIVVVINDNVVYTERIEANSSKTIRLYSETDFPAKLTWSVIRNRKNNGEEIGELLSISNESAIKVDKGGEINVTNVIGNKTYFYPKIVNNLDKQCTIIINDGLIIQYEVGFSNANSNTGITGYFKYSDNSNVTLICGTTIYWYGKRNGKWATTNADRLPLQNNSGVTEISIP